MSTTTTTNNRPDTVRMFGNSACRVAVKKWNARPATAERDEMPESYFIELSTDTGRKTSEGRAIWHQIPLQLGDVSGLVAELKRASEFAQAKEDAAHASPAP